MQTLTRYQTAEERFWLNVVKSDGCWTWRGSHSEGYARFMVQGRTVGAHVYSYTLLVGPVPAGLELDHVCRNRGCVNPKHLDPVTTLENIRRGQGVGAINARKTHCDNGHALVGRNVIPQRGPYSKPNHRRCRACKNEQAKRYRLERKRP